MFLNLILKSQGLELPACYKYTSWTHFRPSESNSLRSEPEEAVCVFTNPFGDLWWKLISFAQNVDSVINVHYNDLDG